MDKATAKSADRRGIEVFIIFFLQLILDESMAGLIPG
jgi:hypothetical protein